MHQHIEIAVGLVVAVFTLGVVARWLRIPYPILLVLGGLVLSFHDGNGDTRLNPDLVLFGFLPPLLYAAAFQTDCHAFRKYLRSILSLAVGLVLFTTVLVAWAAHEFIGISWPLGFVLGAIVSPPDAVAAVAVTRQVRVPQQITTLLEGESLVNDASALVLMRIALAAVAGQAFNADTATINFCVVSAGGVAIGLIVAWVIVRLHGWLRSSGLGDSKLHIALSLLTPYLTYLPAERVGVSGVLAVVSAGLYVSWSGMRKIRPTWFKEAKTVWDIGEFLLTGLAFILIGFQLPAALEVLNSSYSFAALCRYAVIVSGVVIGARMLWVFPGAYIPRWVDRRIWGTGDPYPSWRVVVVVGWAGMRGVVSLAAALALPIRSGEGFFPERDLILFLTFAVILVTLVGQGLTLPYLIRWLRVCPLTDHEPMHSEERERDLGLIEPQEESEKSGEEVVQAANREVEK